jgi:ParB-like chromosome segregation protein Spo0J
VANVKIYKSLQVKTTDVVPYSRNARAHSPEQVTQIVRSITEFGFTSPVLLDENGMLIAGHGRLAAARQMGMIELPAIAIEGLSDAQKQALRLADNKLALNASWDDDLLRTELMDLRDVGFDLGLTGFGEMELDQLFAAEPLAPDGFDSYDEDIETEHECPKCGYVFSGGKMVAKAEAAE